MRTAVNTKLFADGVYGTVLNELNELDARERNCTTPEELFPLAVQYDVKTPYYIWLDTGN